MEAQKDLVDVVQTLRQVVCEGMTGWRGHFCPRCSASNFAGGEGKRYFASRGFESRRGCETV
jgi:hypothetical protein